MIPEHPDDIDPQSSWIKEQPIRYPKLYWEWTKETIAPELKTQRRYGYKHFDRLLINPWNVVEVMGALLASAKKESVIAADLFTAPQLRVLHYHGEARILDLCEPRFSAYQQFNDFTKREDVPECAEYAGYEGDIRSLQLDIRMNLRSDFEDEYKVVWAILAFAKYLELNCNEVLEVDWHDPKWVANFIRSKSGKWHISSCPAG